MTLELDADSSAGRAFAEYVGVRLRAGVRALWTTRDAPRTALSRAWTRRIRTGCCTSRCRYEGRPDLGHAGGHRQGFRRREITCLSALLVDYSRTSGSPGSGAPRTPGASVTFWAATPAAAPSISTRPLNPTMKLSATAGWMCATATPTASPTRSSRERFPPSWATAAFGSRWWVDQTGTTEV